MPHMQPEQVALYLALTFGFFFFSWLLSRRTRSLGMNLIAWGILVIILSCGYALIGAPMMVAVTPTLTKAGFLLVLGGVACSVLAAFPNPITAKEADHV